MSLGVALKNLETYFQTLLGLSQANYLGYTTTATTGTKIVIYPVSAERTPNNRFEYKFNIGIMCEAPVSEVYQEVDRVTNLVLSNLDFSNSTCLPASDGTGCTGYMVIDQGLRYGKPSASGAETQISNVQSSRVLIGLSVCLDTPC